MAKKKTKAKKTKAKKTKRKAKRTNRKPAKQVMRAIARTEDPCEGGE
jgi:hypothetical protein